MYNEIYWNEGETLELKSIEMLKDTNTIVEIKKGFSVDLKYQVDNKFLVRIFPKKMWKEREKEFNIIRKLSILTPYIPRGLDFGFIQEKGYMITDYLPGEDTKNGMKQVSLLEQYQADVAAGEVLREIHKIDLLVPRMNWFDYQQEKYYRKLNALKKTKLELTFLQETEEFIEKHLSKMKEREIRLQHGDFHPANIIIHNHHFAGLIDFNRMEYGDPLFDIAKIGFFTTNSSIAFAKGNILGYIGEEEPSDFWELYALYTAMHLVFALSWASENKEANLEKLINYAKKTAESHENFRQHIPKWMTN